MQPATKKVKVRMIGRGDGLLIGLPPEAFESWVGECFRTLGYDVQVTQFQGDHGVDLLLEKAGERTVVQCKHHPFSTMGEHVLRDLYGAMHDVGASKAVLVTTGQVSKAARAWIIGKPFEVWDAARIKAEWSVEVARMTEELSKRVAPASSVPSSHTDRNQTSWYVYTDNRNKRWAVELPRSIGDQSALGFESLTDPTIPALPRTLRMRYVNLKSREPHPRYLKRIPHGQPKFPAGSYSEGLVFTRRGGGQTTWHITGEYAERSDHIAQEHAVLPDRR